MTTSTSSSGSAAIKKTLEGVKTQLEKQKLAHETMEASIRAAAEASNKTILLEQSHFQLGTVIIAPDWYQWAVNGATVRVQGSTKNHIFKLKENRGVVRLARTESL